MENLENKNLFGADGESLDTAIETTYMLVTGKITLENIHNQGQGIFMMYDPTNLKEKELKDILEDIIIYYIDTEEYEKCQEVKELLNSNLKNLITKITYKKEDTPEKNSNSIDQMIDMLKKISKGEMKQRMDSFFNPDAYKEFLRGPISASASREKDYNFTNVELWSLMTKEDKNIFDTDYGLFTDWTAKLDTRQKNYYTERIINEKPLIPPYAERDSIPWNNHDPGIEPKQGVNFDFEEEYESDSEIDYNSIVVSFISNFTCISNYSLAKIHKIKFQLFTYGILDIELREKKVKEKTVYTLVFDGRQDSKRIDWS